MRTRSISGLAVAGALALAVLLVPAPASADTTIGSGWMNDPTGDVERDGFAKKDVSDLTRLKVALTSKSVKVTLTFDNLKQKKLDLAMNFMNEYGYGALLRMKGDEPGVYFEFNEPSVPLPLLLPLQSGADALRGGAPQTADAEIVCEASFSDKTGKEGTITASFPRSCVTPGGQPKAASIQMSGAVGVAGAEADDPGFVDYTPLICLGASPTVV